MALPGDDSRDIPLRVTEEGDAAITAEAVRLDKKKNDIVRMALREYFEKRGQVIEFSPQRGGKRTRMTEQQAFDRVVKRVEALGLPPPQVEYQVRRKTYDLAWPEQAVAVEISQQQRRDGENDWTVGHVKPTMSDAEIDQVLKALPL